MNKNAIKINETDNVAVALNDIKIGEKVINITAATPIPTGHKIALTNISKNENIIKYGNPIGKAIAEIKKGEHVHTHNIKTNLGGFETYRYNPETVNIPSPPAPLTFMGYERQNGTVGIRNEIWIINTVCCVNKVAEKLVAKAANNNIFTFPHPFGCSQLGDDHKYTQEILKNMVNHPNAAGVLVLGLGCENNNIEEFKKILGTWDDNRVKFLNTQDVEDEISEGLILLNELINDTSTFEKKPIPLSKLVIGLKCGGSDGFSGITANALVGSLSDILISHGGTCLLTEVPEMFGAETLLMNRAVNKDVFNKTVDLINNFKEYFIKYNQEIYENPSPGNKEGGISTLEEKSLGCTQKGGNSNVVDVLNYGETVVKPGLNLLNGPGNDMVAITNLMAAGAVIILFTTGRGTPLGAAVPTLKISSNTKLAITKPHWIDFDSGQLLNGTSLTDLTENFLNCLIDIASGKPTKNEENGYREISIFKDGVTL